MSYLNKIIYYNNEMYKITKVSNNNYYINVLKIDNEVIISSENYEYSEILPKFEKQILKHYIDEITDVKHKIKKSEKLNIINDIDNIYLVNNEIQNNHYAVWKHTLFNVHSINIYITYNIHLLSNEYLKKNKKKYIKTQLFLFFCYIKISKKACNIKDVRDYTKKLNLDIEFLSLLQEHNNNFLKDKKIINNCDSCPICLEIVTQYQGFYKCKHSCCIECYNKWSDNSIFCAICRSVALYHISTYILTYG